MRYVDAVMADGPVGYWRLDESSGTSAADFTGGGHTGAYTGGFTLGQTGALTGSGDSDSSVSFDGSSGYVSFSSTVIGNPTSATFEAWVNGAVGVNSFVGICGSWASNAGVLLEIAGSGLGRMFVNGTNATTAASIQDGNWHHIVGTWDGATITMYVDGVQSGTPVAFAGTVTPGFNFEIAAYNGPPSGAGTSYAGNIDEVAVYTKALSVGQIAGHYNAATVLRIGSPVRMPLGV